ncbi:hypothetical protein GCM10010440_57080 [Kitasatospora cinereorecta]
MVRVPSGFAQVRDEAAAADSTSTREPCLRAVIAADTASFNATTGRTGDAGDFAEATVGAMHVPTRAATALMATPATAVRRLRTNRAGHRDEFTAGPPAFHTHPSGAVEID